MTRNEVFTALREAGIEFSTALRMAFLTPGERVFLLKFQGKFLQTTGRIHYLSC